jgi:hypothetical protein
MVEDRTVGDELAAYRAGRGIPPDGGASLRWVTVRMLGVPITSPTSQRGASSCSRTTCTTC